jgi:hypothetical protein
VTYWILQILLITVYLTDISKPTIRRTILELFKIFRQNFEKKNYLKIYILAPDGVIGFFH